ncbi:MAG: 2-dehydro-3-deoxy-6-phosphogalactonate aldolase [Pseudomonadota bacterium]|nr:2-dehydro-3-deoxy-6-phosphogalactonate aldolase [Pseudomonadota bacterium]
MNARLSAAMAKLPLVAILRGVTPQQAPDVAEALLEEDFEFIEIPLNSPEPLKSIAAVRAMAPARVFVGAGTVLSVDQVEAVAKAGGDLIVTPNTHAEVISRARALGLVCLPGAATPSEAFAALAAGANGVKAFPAEMIGPAVVKAWVAVLPKGTPILPVGGVTPDNMGPYVQAGAAGFGLGSALYRPGDEAAAVRAKAAAFRAAWGRLRG